MRLQRKPTSVEKQQTTFSQTAVRLQSGILSLKPKIGCCSLEQLLARFPNVLCEKIGRFSGWEVGIRDVQGQLHSVFTKVPYTFAAETTACRNEIDALIEAGVVSRFHGKPKHIIPWFSVPKKNSLERRVELDFRGLNTLTTGSPALPMHREGAVQNLSGMRHYAQFDFRHGF